MALSSSSPPRGAPAFVYIGAFVVALIAMALSVRAWVVVKPTTSFTASNVLHVHHLIVTVFSSVNILICVWEIALYFHIDRIQDLYQGYLKKIPRGELPKPLFLFEYITLREALSLRYWAVVWGTYSLLDVSYSQPGSFGYNIDVGNGFTTLLPSLVFLLGAADPNALTGFDARQIGFFCALFFYQALYGTVIYFFQYLNNKRWKDHDTPMFERIALVGGSNVFWILGPMHCLYCCHRMIMENSVQVFYE